MAYGISIYKADGSLAFSSADVTWMQIDQFTVAADGTASNDYPVMSGMTVITQVQMVNDPPDDQEAYAPEVVVTGTTVDVAPFSGLTSEEAIILVLAQDA